jgi:hypothetical protein
MNTGQARPEPQQCQHLSGLVATSVKKWYPHLLRDHEAVANVVQTLFTFPDYREDLDKDGKYRLANRAAYQVCKESGWRKDWHTKKWFRPETTMTAKRDGRTVPFVEVAKAKEETASPHGILAERLREAATHHEALAILKSEGFTGKHVEQHVRKMFRDRVKTQQQMTARKTAVRNPRHQFIADNWDKPAKQIAEELGISVPAVHMAAKAMGLPPKSRFWHSRPQKLAAWGSGFEDRKRKEAVAA